MSFAWPRSHRPSSPEAYARQLSSAGVNVSKMRREGTLPSHHRLQPLAVPRPLARLAHEPLLLPTPAQFAVQNKKRNVAPISPSKPRSLSPRPISPAPRWLLATEMLDLGLAQEQQQQQQPLLDASADFRRVSKVAFSAEDISPVASAPSPDSAALGTPRALRHSKTLSSLTAPPQRRTVKFGNADDRRSRATGRNRRALLKSNTMPNIKRVLKLNLEPASRSRSRHRQAGFSNALSGLTGGGGSLRWSAPVWWEMPSRVGEIAEEYDSRQVRRETLQKRCLAH